VRTIRFCGISAVNALLLASIKLLIIPWVGCMAGFDSIIYETVVGSTFTLCGFGRLFGVYRHGSGSNLSNFFARRIKCYCLMKRKSRLHILIRI
jgi:hypothetical protein